MSVMMCMTSVNASAQRHHGHGGHGHGGYGGPRHEMYDTPGHHHGGAGRFDGPRHGSYYHYDAPHHGVGHHHAGPRWRHDGYLYGWEGRVRHFDDGRWGYYRDNRWYYYNTYFEPDYYYAQPIHTFHSHVCSDVATAAVVGAAVGTMVEALMR